MIFNINETKRSELPDDKFGIPEDRKYPLDTDEHIKSAIKLFGHAEESKKKSLANRIKKAADFRGIEIPKDSKISIYLNETSISSISNLITNLLDNVAPDRDKEHEDALDAFSYAAEAMALANVNPLVSYSKPFILKYAPAKNSVFSGCEYAFTSDISSGKCMIVDEDSKLHIVDNDFLSDMYVEAYEFNYEHRDRLSALYKAYKEQEIVDKSFIYTTLANKPLLSNDQIEYDDLFSKVDFDLYGEKLESFTSTMNALNTFDTSLPVLESTLEDDMIIVMEDVDGYYYKNIHTGMRTRSVESEDSLTATMYCSIL